MWMSPRRGICLAPLWVSLANESAVSQPLAAATTKVPPKASESTIRIRTAADQTDSGDTAVDGYGSELGLVKQQDPDPTGATVYKLTGTVNCCTNPEEIGRAHV